MNALDSFNAGALSEAMEAIGSEIKSNPADPKRRTFLFELLCFSGDLERAGKQLDVIAQQGAESEVAVQHYRQALRAEAARRQVFAGNGIPGLPKEIPSYTGLHLKAIQCLHECKSREAIALLEEAVESYPSLRGELNGTKFISLSDCDDLLGPFLEVFVGATYSWVPWESIESVQVAPPKYLRDLIWLPAQIELIIGSLGQVFLPCLYPGSYECPSDPVRLGRLTEWRTDVEGLSLGLGQKLLAADDREIPFAEIRTIEFATTEQDANANS